MPSPETLLRTRAAKTGNLEHHMSESFMFPLLFTIMSDRHEARDLVIAGPEICVRILPLSSFGPTRHKGWQSLHERGVYRENSIKAWYVQ